MRHSMLTLAVVLTSAAALVAQQPAPAAKAGAPTEQAKIRQAMSAAPSDISRGAAVMDLDMKELRKGTNGWTCMPSSPEGVGGLLQDPMCLDKSFMGWAEAWMSKKDPQVKAVGVAYMLKGDKGASNTDPYAKAPSPTNNWVVSPPHVMVVVPDPSQLDAMPTDPHNGGPWVMWKGTKYAHIMVPVASVPKAATK